MLLNVGADVFGDGDCVLTALLADFKNNAWFTVELSITGLVFNRVFYPPDVADPNGLAIGSIRRWVWPRILPRVSCFGEYADTELARAPLGDQPTTRQFGSSRAELRRVRRPQSLRERASRLHRARYAFPASRPPTSSTEPTPGTRCKRSLTSSSAKAVKSRDGHVA